MSRYSSGMMLTQLARGQVRFDVEGQNFFRLCHLIDPLLHLAANVVSKLETHEDILSPWRGECDSDECLGSLTVWCSPG